MNIFSRRSAKFLWDEQGLTTVEYAVIFGLLILVAVASVSLLGSGASVQFDGASNMVAAAGTVGGQPSYSGPSMIGSRPSSNNGGGSGTHGNQGGGSGGGSDSDNGGSGGGSSGDEPQEQQAPPEQQSDSGDNGGGSNNGGGDNNDQGGNNGGGNDWMSALLRALGLL